jgi:hypothetical protein
VAVLCLVGVCALACSPVEPVAQPSLDLYRGDITGVGGPRGIVVTDDEVIVASWATDRERPSEIVRLRAHGPDAGRPLMRHRLAIDGSSGDELGPVVVRAGQNGEIWFTMPLDHVVGRLPAEPTAAPVLLHDTGPSDMVDPGAIDTPFVTATVASGDTWFTNFGNDSLGVVRASGHAGACTGPEQCSIERLALPGLLDQPVAIVEGPDVIGSDRSELWVTNWGDSNRVVVVDPEILDAPEASWQDHVAVAVDFDESSPVLSLDPVGSAGTRSGPRSLVFADRDGDGESDEIWVAHHDADAMVRLDVDSCDPLPCEVSNVVGGADGPTAAAVGGVRVGGSGSVRATHLYFTNDLGSWLGRVDLVDPGAEPVRHRFDHLCPEGKVGGSAVDVGDDGDVWFSSYACGLMGRLDDPAVDGRGAQ